jgi:hypothetical protein
MANLGLSNTHVNRFNEGKRNASRRHRLQTAVHVGLFSAAFLFVVAIVCGVLV